MTEKLSIGDKSVGASVSSQQVFASQGLGDQQDVVALIRDRAAHLLDAINAIGLPDGYSDAGRLAALARTDLESAVMWAVKAVSRCE